jgi:predicted dehydrogenase
MFKMALVGCGRIGARHAALIQRTGILVAVCDIDPAKPETAGVPPAIPRFTDYREMLDAMPETDVVVICTPNGLHASQSILALEKGFHVLCEKPMALSTRDSANMIRVATAVSRGLFIVKQNRFNPPVLAVRRLLDKGALGLLTGFQLNGFWNREDDYFQDAWRGTKTMDGGILFTQFSHFIDLLIWFCGKPVVVNAMEENYQHRASARYGDTCIALARMGNGSMGTLHFTINAYQRNMEGSLTLFGETGTVKIGGQYLDKLEYQSLAGGDFEAIPAGRPANDYGGYQGSMSNHADVYTALVRTLQNDGPFASNMQDGHDTVEFIEKIYNATAYSYDRP